MINKKNKKIALIAVSTAAIARYIAKISALAITVSLMAGVMLVPSARASSHRDSPFILEDPTADNTDVYAFVSYEPGREQYVTLIANYVPLQEPSNGPNFFKLSDFVNYEINIDVDGDAHADLTYQFKFISRIVDPGTYLYNINTILPPPNPADPTSQYVNLNQPQSYTLTERGRGAPSSGRVLLANVRTAPNRPGPKSINSAPVGREGTPVRGDTTAAYQNLAQMAVHTAPDPAAGGLRAFVGPRDEGFFVGTGTAFDLINPSAPGADGTGGFNVHTLAVEIPKARLRAGGDTDGIIGVWATASRTRYPVCNSQGASGNTPCIQPGTNNGVGTQVSRLANPLFNEFLDPLRAKDLYNATAPFQDEKNIFPGILNPATEQGPNTLVQQLREFTRCTDVVNRRDQVASWMLGYPAGVVRGFPGNRETQTANPAIAEQMRLNYTIPPKPFGAQDNKGGLLNGDFAGMPNGRRVGDDSVDILLRLWGGELQREFGSSVDCALIASRLTDNVDANDVPFLPVFPYLGLPQEGFNHAHIHNQP
jgi:hypothetical protein